MNPEQKTRKLAREFRQFYKVIQHHRDVCQNRGYKTSTGPRDAEIRGYYRLIHGYLGLTQDRVQRTRQLFQKWADRHSMPQRFDQPYDGVIKLRTMMADEGIGLTDAQVDNYVVVDEEWTGPGKGLNKYERFFEVTDALCDLAACFETRMQFWINEWTDQGSTPRERQIISILGGAQNGIVVLIDLITDIVAEARDEKGDAEAVDELRLRNRFFKRRGPMGSTGGGGFYAINRGVTTTAGIEGGQPLTAGPDPVEWDADINTVRDEPAMGTDPGP